MKYLVILASLFGLAACTPQTPPQPPAGMSWQDWQPVQEFFNTCTDRESVCESDVAYTIHGHIFLVRERRGQIVPYGTWPDFESLPHDGRRLAVFLSGLQSSDFEGIIRKVVSIRHDGVEKHREAVAEWEKAMQEAGKNPYG